LLLKHPALPQLNIPIIEIHSDEESASSVSSDSLPTTDQSSHSNSMFESVSKSKIKKLENKAKAFD